MASITTPRVIQARTELVNALKESIKLSGLKPDQAEGKLSALMGEIWNEAERIVKQLPGVYQ